MTLVVFNGSMKTGLYNSDKSFIINVNAMMSNRICVFM